MSGWTPEELVRIGQADELDLAFTAARRQPTRPGDDVGCPRR
jgi:hypothetical protein